MSVHVVQYALKKHQWKLDKCSTKDEEASEKNSFILMTPNLTFLVQIVVNVYRGGTTMRTLATDTTVLMVLKI